MELSNKAKFLRFVKILVDETTKEAPLSKAQILRRCREEGLTVGIHAFDSHIEDMRQAGIIIKRRHEQNKKSGDYLYWYDAGWI